MGISKKNKAIIKRYREPLSDAVREELGAEYEQLLDFIFDEIKVSVSKLEKVYLPKLGSLGITRQFASKLCTQGMLHEKGHEELCKTLADKC